MKVSPKIFNKIFNLIYCNTILLPTNNIKGNHASNDTYRFFFYFSSFFIFGTGHSWSWTWDLVSTIIGRWLFCQIFCTSPQIISCIKLVMQSFVPLLLKIKLIKGKPIGLSHLWITKLYLFNHGANCWSSDITDGVLLQTMEALSVLFPIFWVNIQSYKLLASLKSYSLKIIVNH